MWGKRQIIVDEDAPEVSSCRKGDLASFERLVGKYEKKMFNIAYRITGSHEDACEVVQDAFVAAYRGLSTFRGGAKFSTWLTSITINGSRNRLKRVRGRREFERISLENPFPPTEGGKTLDPPASDPPADELLEKRDVRSKVRDCIDLLEPDFKEVLILRDLQDCSYDEISAILKVQMGTVKSRLFRAREAVKDCLKRALGDLF
jgi:RNA polymerase sigma-70 factor, ECF subfamily